MKFWPYFWKNNRFLTAFFAVLAAVVAYFYFTDEAGSGNGIFLAVIAGIYLVVIIGTYIAWRKTFK